jgi:hypothetical protein
MRTLRRVATVLGLAVLAALVLAASAFMAVAIAAHA